jgi:hypothetical protein
LKSNVFDINGKLLEARKLHSITLTSFCLAINWILKGPVILSALAIALAIFFIRRMVSTYSFCAGNTNVASPLYIKHYIYYN